MFDNQYFWQHRDERGMVVADSLEEAREKVNEYYPRFKGKFDIWKAGLEKLWRWSDDNGGGIVKARSIEEAELKLSKYGRKDCKIWPWLKDDYYDEKNPDVFDIY